MKPFFIDGHCDTITAVINSGQSFYENTHHIDIKRLQQFEAPVQFFAAWIEPAYYGGPLRRTLAIIDRFFEELDQHSEWIRFAKSVNDIERNRKLGKISAVLTVEDGAALEGEISSLRMLYRLGVRSLTLTWNYRNQIGDGALEEITGGGLTRFGREVVYEMNRMGMLIDVSHLSEAGFWDVEKLSTKPFAATHSNARALCDHPRNLTDKQLKAIAEKGGLVGVNAYPFFLEPKGDAAMDHLLNHIAYITKRIGMEHIGIGCDFDGIEKGPKGFEQVGKLLDLYVQLEKRYGLTGAEKIMGLNYMKILSEVWDH